MPELFSGGGVGQGIPHDDVNILDDDLPTIRADGAYSRWYSTSYWVRWVHWLSERELRDNPIRGQLKPDKLIDGGN
jgi:hypothetical protein